MARRRSMAVTPSPVLSTSFCARTFRARRPTPSTIRPNIPAAMQSTSPQQRATATSRARASTPTRWSNTSSTGESRRATGRLPQETTFRKKASIAPASIPFRPTSTRLRVSETRRVTRRAATPALHAHRRCHSPRPAARTSINAVGTATAHPRSSIRANVSTSSGRSPGRSIRTTSCFSRVPTSRTAPSFPSGQLRSPT